MIDFFNVINHKSYVVNIEHITAINNFSQIAILNNGRECPISRRFIKELTEKYKRHCRKF
ncbi:LytTR family transcriptional regulator DNA-binding domain-containing protein [Kineothrix sedimenti]|uniref:LytTR family transcriptional regulator DNA-binding domain-containing protein n=1 Tax=Kineothrix sedimenti TaxID=3123317 RepID=UPI003CC81958